MTGPGCLCGIPLPARCARSSLVVPFASLPFPASATPRLLPSLTLLLRSAFARLLCYPWFAVAVLVSGVKIVGVASLPFLTSRLLSLCGWVLVSLLCLVWLVCCGELGVSLLAILWAFASCAGRRALRCSFEAVVYGVGCSKLADNTVYIGDSAPF